MKIGGLLSVFRFLGEIADTVSEFCFGAINLQREFYPGTVSEEDWAEAQRLIAASRESTNIIYDIRTAIALASLKERVCPFMDKG